MAKIDREKFKTYGNVFDRHTLRNIFMLSSKGHFVELKSPISTGKEANIFTAAREDGSLIVVKIYRLETCDFNKMYDYIKMDPRYSYLKSKSRKVIFAWAQREFRNLMKAREIGVRVPTPILCKDNILLLEYIGKEEPALKIKDADFTKEKAEKYLRKIRQYMKKMYQHNLIHGDLSSFNILDDDKPVLIDFSQATTRKNTNAEELLQRDVRNICNFFIKQGLDCDKKEMEAFIKKS
ncbi:MAG: serine protein kinase RIO [Candidatus Nanoarchaeia archaeon]